MAQTHFPNRDDDQRRRIERLKQQIRDVTGEQPIFGVAPDCPPEVEEAFLKQVLAFHTARRGNPN